MVAPGTYVENIQFNNKSPIIISESGPDSTIIDGNYGDGIYLNGGGGVINGFSIKNSNIGLLSDSDNDYLLIQSCIFFENYKAINLQDTYNTDIVNTLIYENDFGIVQNYYGGSSTIVNCTFDNTQDLHFGPGYGTSTEMNIINSIFMSTVEGADQNPIYLYYCDYDPVNLLTNVNPITGNITDDPLFVDQANHDYHLQYSSPCIDAGDPSSAYDPDGTIADMGALYFHQNIFLNEPTNIEISISDDVVQISWDEVAGANSYLVYSSSNVDGEFTQISGSSNEFTINNGRVSWSGSNQDTNCFYYITASTESWSRFAEIKGKTN